MDDMDIENMELDREEARKKVSRQYFFFTLNLVASRMISLFIFTYAISISLLNYFINIFSTDLLTHCFSSYNRLTVSVIS